MGGRSRSSSSNTSGQTQSTMNDLSRGRVSNDAVSGMQQDLKNSQMSDVVGGFGAMLQDAKSMFGQNPMMNMMGGMLGMPIQMETPDAMTDFINKYREPQQSAYEQRIAERMQNKGETRQEAVANQAHALKMGTDYNNDGAVTNDEWAKYQQMQQPQQPGQQQPQQQGQQQPQGMPQGMPQGIPLVPFGGMPQGTMSTERMPSQPQQPFNVNQYMRNQFTGR